MALNVTDQAAFVGQIARHQAGLHAYIVSLMPGMEGVDDVLQETNIVIWEKRETFKMGSDFLAWACAIARYKVMNHRRAMAKLDHRMFDDDLALQLAEESLIKTDEADQRMLALNRCLGKLKEKERVLIERRYTGGSSLQDLARDSGNTAASLRVILFRIRAGLRRCIQSEMSIQQTKS